ncbi:MAG TPA: sigma-70 family RNA polymerase sigma factor [Pirellulaceae bacterium]|nr:sigma-70 family RNA polymerase sigma factor [Pirellulaceae bacterium]
MSAPHDDQRLIAETLAGDCQAFGRLVAKYQDRLLGSMCAMVRNESDAQDIVQDALVMAFRKLHLFSGRSSFYTWLFQVARNVAISKLRSQKRTVSLDGSPHDSANGGPMTVEDRGPSPEDHLRREEDVELLRAALCRLSEEFRAILVLREMDDMDYEQIAEVLEIPVGTVRSRLHRARAQLRVELESLMKAAER